MLASGWKPFHLIILPLEVLEINISIRIVPPIKEELNHSRSSTPSLRGESANQVRTVEQGARRPQLAIPGPALVDPIDHRNSLLHQVEHHTRTRGCLASENASLEQRYHAAADGEECAALLKSLADEGNLGGACLVLEVMSTHESNVKRRARFKGVLHIVSWIVTTCGGARLDLQWAGSEHCSPV